ARRDGGVLVYRVQIARASRQRQRESHERPAPRGNDGCEFDAFRLQAHALWRVQDDRRGLISLYVRQTPDRTIKSAMAYENTVFGRMRLRRYSQCRESGQSSSVSSAVPYLHAGRTAVGFHEPRAAAV